MSIIEAVMFLIKTPKSFKRILQSLLLFNKDSLTEYIDIFLDMNPKNMSARVDNIITSIGCLFWTSSLFKVILSALTFNISNIISSIISIVIQFVIITICILGLYNHKESWHHILLKALVAVTLVALIIFVFSMLGALFSFSLLGALKFLKYVILIMYTLCLLISILEW